MKLHIEPTPGDSIHECAERAQNIADCFAVKVQFRFNGSDCLAVPGGRSDWLPTNFERRRENGLVASNRKPETEQQFPPAGMAIQVRYDYPTKGVPRGVWQNRVSEGDGFFRTVDGLSFERLSDVEWRYWPAPSVWPDRAECWIATRYGSYMFVPTEAVVGRQIREGRIQLIPIHVERRPEGK